MPMIKTESRLFIFLVGLAAVSVATWAAVFSVTGLSMLYSGRMLYVAIAMGILEFSKIVVASYLYRHWQDSKWWLKAYLTIALVVLMLVTSGGIYGYLTSSYQGATIGLDKINSQSQVLEQTRERLYSERKRITGDLERLRQERQHTISNRNDEIAAIQISDSTRYLDRSQRQRVYNRYDDELKRVDNSITKGNIDLDSMNVKIGRTEQQISDKKLEIIDTGIEIGPLVYMARIFNTTMDQVMKWFTLVIVFVFDPLAVALVLALNVIIAQRARRKKLSLEDDEIYLDEPFTDDIIQGDKIIEKEIEFDKNDEKSEDALSDALSVVDVPTAEKIEKPKRSRFSDDVLKYKKIEPKEERVIEEPIPTEKIIEVIHEVKNDKEEVNEDVEDTNFEDTIDYNVVNNELDNDAEPPDDKVDDPEIRYNKEIEVKIPLTGQEIKDMVEDAAREVIKSQIGKKSTVIYESGGGVKYAIHEERKGR